MLLAAPGLTNISIAARLDTPRQIVSKWRKRFASGQVPGPSKSNLGAAVPPSFPPSVVVQVKALACELPHRRGLPLFPGSRSPRFARRWRPKGSSPKPVARPCGVSEMPTPSRPWQHRSWIFPRDPDFPLP